MESKIVIMHETSSSTWGKYPLMKSIACGTAKGDVIAEGGNKEALFIRTGITPALAASAASPASRVFSVACA